MDCADCASWRDLRRVGRRANVYGGIDVLEQKGDISDNVEKGDFRTEKQNDFEHIPGFSEFGPVRQKNVNKVNLLKKIGKWAHRRHILRYEIFYFWKGDS